MAVLLNFARAILFYFICLRASYVLHNRMFSVVLRTFVQFFDNNPAGRNDITYNIFSSLCTWYGTIVLQVEF